MHCLVGSRIVFRLFSVKYEKDHPFLLEARDVEPSSWKRAHPEDTDSDVGESSEEEAELGDLPEDPGIQRKEKADLARMARYRKEVEGSTVSKDQVVLPKPPKGSKYVLVSEDQVVVKKSELHSLREEASDLDKRIGALEEGKALPKPGKGVGSTELPFKIPQLESGQKVCPLCQRIFYSHFRMKRHMRTHTGEGLIECDTCGKRVTTHKALDEHHKICGKPREKRCEASIVIDDGKGGEASVPCGALFPTTEALKKHHANVHKDYYKRCECGNDYHHAKSFQDHWRACDKNPGKTGPWFCTVKDCTKAISKHPFKLIKHYNTHLRKVHGHQPKRAKLADD